MELERVTVGIAENVSTTVAGSGSVSAQLLDHQLLRCAFHCGQSPLGITQNESKPAGMCSSLCLPEGAFQRVLVEHLGDEHVTGDANARPLDAEPIPPGPTKGNSGRVETSA